MGRWGDRIMPHAVCLHYPVTVRRLTRRCQPDSHPLYEESLYRTFSSFQQHQNAHFRTWWHGDVLRPSGEILQLGLAAPQHLRVGQRVIGEHCTGVPDKNHLNPSLAILKSGCLPQTSAETLRCMAQISWSTDTTGGLKSCATIGYEP